MGNCTQPTQSSDVETANIPMGSFVKNSVLRRTQLQAAKNLSSGHYINVYIYSKCDGLTVNDDSYPTISPSDSTRSM